MTTDYSDSRDRFQRETAGHEMTVLHDDGLYRHLRFNAPGGGFNWFDLITVPHALIYRGDGESFVFSRIEDMFEFFRSPAGRIYPGYWAEKLTSSPDAAKSYSEDLFRQHVAEAVKECEGDFSGLGKAVEEEFFGEDSYCNTEYEETAREALNSFEYQPDGAEGDPFTFEDSWEWDLRGWDWWFLWACQAIVWGIAQYDAARQLAPAGGEVR
jgi:hypothetical protein